MAPGAPRRRRARPVADAPIDSLLARLQELAKGWMLALLEQAPLEHAPEVLTDELTSDGPRLCGAVVRALADDADLRRLERGGALRPLAARAGALAGADDPGGTSAAVDALQGVVWAALRAELGGGAGLDPDLVSELAERLALACEIVREAALEGDRGPWGGGAPRTGGSARELSAVPPRDVSGGVGRAVRPGVPVRPPEPPPPAASDALWLSALNDEVRRARRGAGPLALLLAELEDADRVVMSASPERADAAFGDFAAALRGAVRRQDILVRESGARAWIIARDTTRAGAHTLGTRIAERVGATSPWAGAPLVATVGVAVFGEDGDTAHELIDAAEEARFGAAARGIEVSRRVLDHEHG